MLSLKSSPTMIAVADEKPPQILLDVAALAATEKVFAGIEESQLEILPKNYPTANLTRKIAEFQEAFAAADEPRRKQAEMRLRQELQLWRVALVKRDEQFSAFDLRSHCEHAEPALDLEIFPALAGFYRNLPPTVTVLNKFDYAVTRYFSRKRENNRRALRCETDKIVVELRDLNARWTGGATAPAQNVNLREIISALAALSAEAKAEKSLRAWVEKDFFNRIRQCKQKLSESFFIPEVTTALIVGNLVIGNHFAALCEADSRKLTDAASIFAADEDANRAIAAQLRATFDSLLHIGLEEDFAETVAQERLSHLYSLADDLPAANEPAPAAHKPFSEPQIISEITPTTDDAPEKQSEPLFAETEEAAQTNPPAAENQPESQPEAVEILEAEIIGETEEVQAAEIVEAEEIQAETDGEASGETHVETLAQEPEAIYTVEGVIVLPEIAETESAPTLETALDELQKFSPNVAPVEEYLQQSSTAEIRELRVAAFLSANPTDEDAKNQLRALRLILRAEDAARFVNAGEGELLADFQDEVHLLREEINLLNQRLRRAMRDTAGKNDGDANLREHLEAQLYVTNSLVEAQLRLDSAITRRQNREEERLAEAAAALEAARTAAPQFEKITINESPVRTARIAKKVKAAAKSKTSRGLIAAAVLLTLVGGGWFGFDYLMANGAATAVRGNVKDIELAKLSGGEYLTAAKVAKETLVGVVGANWNSLSADAKRETLQKLLKQGAAHKYNSVMLLTAKGAIVARATEKEVKLL